MKGINARRTSKGLVTMRCIDFMETWIIVDILIMLVTVALVI